MSELNDFFEEIENSDEKLNRYVELNEALASFVNDLEFLKDTNNLTQKDIAKLTGTTQSAISRIESFKTNPSYKVLQNLSKAVGGTLLVTPMGDMTVTVPYDLQEKVKAVAQSGEKSVKDFLLDTIRNTVDSEYVNIDNMTLFSTVPMNISTQKNVSKSDYEMQKTAEIHKNTGETSLLSPEDVAA